MPERLPTHNKREIRQAFDKAAQTYDQAATVQRTICQHLLAALQSRLSPEVLATSPCCVLDAGCGTGYGLGLLSQSGLLPAETTWLALDFAPGMLGSLSPPSDACMALSRIAGDMENLPLADNSLNLYWSSLAAQWCDAATVFAEAARTLKPGGQLALATLGPDTFHEMRQAFRAVDQYQHTLAFAPPEALETVLRRLPLAHIGLIRQTVTTHYPELRSLLAAVKAVGANRVGAGRRSGMMGKTAWQALEAAYEAQRTAAGLPLSYDVLYCYASKQ